MTKKSDRDKHRIPQYCLIHEFQVFTGVWRLSRCIHLFDGFGRDCGMLLFRPLSINLKMAVGHPFSLRLPCLTMRDNTERPETITIGTNELIGTDPNKLPPALARLMAGQWKKWAIPPKWDGKAAERIVEFLERVRVSK